MEVNKKVKIIINLEQEANWNELTININKIDKIPSKEVFK